MSHTPGPWICYESDLSRNDFRLFFVKRSDMDARGRIAETFTADDANLIAAAPDLLTALKRVRAEISEAELNYSSLVPAIDSAVAKAEGRS